MNLTTIKQRRITKIVREFAKAQDSYDITGVDLSLSKFFYRASQELFQDLATGDYRIDTSSGRQTLIITNQEILSVAEAFQVGYVLDFTATKYETQWNVDINTLKDRYNQLVDNTQELWEYIRKTGFISDDTTIDLILPQLDINEVWVRGENGYAAMPIDDIQTSIKDAIQKYLLEVVYPTIDGYVEATSKPALDEYVETTIKPEIDDFTDAKEVELQDLKDILANQLQELVDNALADRGVIPNGTDWNTLSYGTWYVSDLNGSNYTNHPNLEDTEGVGVVLVTDSQGGNAKVIRYYSMQKKMHFKIKNATGVWSEWSALSSGGGVRYEYTQANHGFLFTPVMLDGISGEWVRATTNGADGIAVYISIDRFELIMNGSVQIPNSAKDVNGDVFVNDEYYFLSNNVAGGLDREKPTGIFQPMIRTYLDEQGRMWAEVEVDTPVDLVPRVLNEEAEILGIQMEVDNRLQTESKTVVGAINELNDRVGIENTIADLVASTRYSLGDVVEVLGFHTKGDGSHHKRIAKDKDDGSGEQGVDGLIWCILHNGEVNVSWFGAKGDGTTDDTLPFKKSVENFECVKIDKNIQVFGNVVSIHGKKRKLIIKGDNTTIFWSNNIGDKLFDISGMLGFNLYGFNINVKNENLGAGFGTVFKLHNIINPDINYQTMTMNKITDVKIEGFSGMVDKVFDVSGDAHCDQTLITNCKFAFYKTLINCTNKESVGWVFQKCDFYAFHNLATHFIFDELQSSFTIKDCTMSAMQGETIFKSTNSTGAINGTAKYLIDNLRVEQFDRLQYQDKGIIIADVEYGSLNVKNCFFNAGSANIKNHRFKLYKNASATIGNSTLNNVIVDGVGYDNNTYVSSFVKINDSWMLNYTFNVDGIDIIETKKQTYNIDCNGIKFLTNGDYNTPNRGYSFSFLGNENNFYGIEKKLVYSLNKNNRKIELPKFCNITKINIKKCNIKNSQDISKVGFLTKNKNTAIESLISNIPKTNNSIFADAFLIYKNNKTIIQKEYDYYYNLEFVLYNDSWLSVDSDFDAIVEIEINGILKSYPSGITNEPYTAILTGAQQLDTPYHATNMQKLGILYSYHNYLTELHEYEKQQSVQSDSEIINLNVLQPPVIPTEVEAYAKEYNLI